MHDGSVLQVIQHHLQNVRFVNGKYWHGGGSRDVQCFVRQIKSSMYLEVKKADQTGEEYSHKLVNCHTHFRLRTSTNNSKVEIVLG